MIIACTAEKTYAGSSVKMRYAWQLIDENGQPADLWTNVYADVYIDVDTREEYTRGEAWPFETVRGDRPFPELIENTDKFQFIFPKRQKSTIQPQVETYLREIMVQGLFNSFRK